MSIRLVNPVFPVLQRSFDIDALRYLAAVQVADGQRLESVVAREINNFVVGCKSDGIWEAIKASCILAGAHTLAGALVPLAGLAPTNVGPFAAGDYSRKGGLVGNGSNYLNTNYAFTSAIQNNRHGCVWLTARQANGQNAAYFGSSLSDGSAPVNQMLVAAASDTKLTTRLSDVTSVTTTGDLNQNGLVGISRSASGSYTVAGNGVTETVTVNSLTSLENNVHVFRRNFASSPVTTIAGIGFYSFGEAINLALLRSRLTALFAAIGAAIP